MLELFDDLYDNKAYLNALHDWLVDEDGGESVRVKAIEYLLTGSMVIIKDPRISSGYMYDLLIRYSGLDNTWETYLDREYVYHFKNADDEFDRLYGEMLSPYVDWFRYSSETPTGLLDLTVEYLQTKEFIR